MGTKNNPGDYDCYEMARPDEPIFTLKANDHIAPDVVRSGHDTTFTPGHSDLQRHLEEVLGVSLD